VLYFEYLLRHVVADKIFCCSQGVVISIRLRLCLSCRTEAVIMSGLWLVQAGAWLGCGSQ